MFDIPTEVDHKPFLIRMLGWPCLSSQTSTWAAPLGSCARRFKTSFSVHRTIMRNANSQKLGCPIATTPRIGSAASGGTYEYTAVRRPVVLLYLLLAI